MNRTESFTALLVLAVVCDVENPTGWMAAAYIAGMAVLFVIWFGHVNNATRLDR